MASAETPKSQCASMTSRPLFISVAESMVIFRPICHVGWRSAASGRTAPSAARGISSKRASRGRQDEAAHLVGRAAVQALVDRVVFTVHRQNGHSVAAGRGGDQFTGHDQHFLVGKGDALAGFDGSHHRLEPRRACGRAQDDVSRGFGGYRNQAFGAGDHHARKAWIRRTESVGSFARPQGHYRGPDATRLLRQQLGVVAGGKRHDLKAVGMRVHDRQRAAADRAGRSEDREPFQRPPRTYR